MSLEKKPRKLDGITARLFQHPSDRAILQKLEGVPMLPSLVGKALDELKDEMELDLLSDAFLVTSSSLPDVYDTYRRTCDTLCVNTPPPLYIQYSPTYNAYTMGVDNAFVVIHSSLASDLDANEMTYVFGHELGHYLSGHIKYQTFVQLLAGNAIANINGLAKILANVTVGPLLYLWARRAEYTADRAGLLACQDLNIAHRANLLLAGCPKKFQQHLSPDVFIEQSQAFEERASRGVFKNLALAAKQVFRDHPRLVERSLELKKWVDEGWFEDIVEGTVASRMRMAESLADDPQTAEMLALLTRNIAKCCATEFALDIKTASTLIRRAIFGEDTLKSTPLQSVLRIEWAIEKDGSVLHNFACLLVNRKDAAVRLKYAIPMPEQWEDAPSEIRHDFIENRTQSLIRVLYTV